MRSIQRFSLLCILPIVFLFQLVLPAAASEPEPLVGDALYPPPPARALAAAADPRYYQPSAFMSGRIAVELVLPESTGELEPSTEDWSSEQVALVQQQIAAALDWWRARLPAAGLEFELNTRVVPTRYEPIAHQLSDEGLWIGDVLGRLGYDGSNHFERAYAAHATLRAERDVDWSVLIFLVDSDADSDGRFADNRFAYAYIGGPFLVLTSDVGAYTAKQLAPIAAHELGHAFGALDQYAGAGVPCTEPGGYLAVPTSNSQANNCGTHLPSIMLDPVSAYPLGAVDPSALGQVGYRDSDNDGLPDPIDTAPELDLELLQPSEGNRPHLSGSVYDRAFASPTYPALTINTIARVEYRINGGAWVALPPADGAYDSSFERVAEELPLYDGTYTVAVRAINNRGSISPLFQRSVTVSGVGAPPAFTLEAPPASNTIDIVLALSAPEGAYVQLSANPYFQGAAWVPVRSSMPWQLQQHDGPQALYARLRDAGGLVTPPLVRTIVLDRQAPTGSAHLHKDNPPWIKVQAHDPISGVAAVQIIQGSEESEWLSFQQALAVTSPDQAIWVRLRDRAGNVSEPLPAQEGYTAHLPLLRQ